MRAHLTVIITAFAVSSLAATASAQSPHFDKKRTSDSISSSGALTANFRISGLGNDISSVKVTLSATATAVYECVNNGGKNPSAANKRSVTKTVSTTSTFPVHNGSSSGTLTVQPPPAPDFECPPGQTEVFKSVSYTKVTISAPGAGSLSLANKSYTNPNAP